MIKTIKIMLNPNNKQNTKLFQMAGSARFAYNWTIDYEQNIYKTENKFVSDIDLRKIFTQLKKEFKYKWLNNISNDVTKQSIKDAVLAYKRFF
jgi:Helix-turn-helix domain.